MGKFFRQKEFCPVKVRHLLIILRCGLDSFADGVLQLLGSKDLFEEGELSQEMTISKMETVINRGKRGEVYEFIDFYNLDAIIAVGYRVSSLKATRFRQWATKILNLSPSKIFTSAPKIQSLRQHLLLTCEEGLEEID